VQRDRQVIIMKGSKQVRGTHFLKSAERGTSQDSKRKWASKGHSHSKEHIGQVETRKESKQARGTHILESAEVGHQKKATEGVALTS
jgi:hypothetical protein